MDADYYIGLYYELKRQGIHDGLSLREFLERESTPEIRSDIYLYDEFKRQGIHDGKTLKEHLRKR